MTPPLWQPVRPGTPPTGWRRWFPHPVLSLMLGAAWIVLVHSTAPAHVLTALILAWALPRALAPFLGDASRLHWPTAVRLLLTVLWDIVVANVTVARLTLGSMQRLRPAWLRVPLASAHPRVNALFASIITTTPGTVSAVIDEARGVIWVHALDAGDDPAAMIREMKSRYESPLLRIFQVDLGAQGAATTGEQAQ
ncbi:Na+/H+ antiporter subunit E [Tepidimonas taiwanensis]|uniref:Multicomponent Na+:H+ antiporter n=1 Tax=Tepidimonas taiwanensis TaxID=307486 RepID=A0A554X6B0_9BURK|nr:Na+/H+ antiporter subunit E [Tepidimonas taiwanensis]MCX7691932.1 Na+/H+ antiporter subunit E [Tepidimonas taiwanensis]MDM7463848.1 Na+/H+ antiporter subunit E [Tepidimonas taiwanensis]TSE31369.1 multicomponent Na+:H+ antiporter [Tepidimonas taiwanensis]UBQ06115.1 Na+/H+ antiporter subunit E [Tepidimonas taiwanensis]